MRTFDVFYNDKLGITDLKKFEKEFRKKYIIKEKNKRYLELEKDLLLENSRVHLEQFHELEIAEIQENILKLEEKARRNEESQYYKV